MRQENWNRHHSALSPTDQHTVLFLQYLNQVKEMAKRLYVFGVDLKQTLQEHAPPKICMHSKAMIDHAENAVDVMFGKFCSVCVHLLAILSQMASECSHDRIMSLRSEVWVEWSNASSFHHQLVLYMHSMMIDPVSPVCKHTHPSSRCISPLDTPSLISDSILSDARSSSDTGLSPN